MGGKGGPAVSPNNQNALCERGGFLGWCRRCLLGRASKHLKMLNKTYSTCTHTHTEQQGFGGSVGLRGEGR